MPGLFRRRSEPAMEARGSLLRGVIDEIARRDGVEGVEEVMESLDVSPKAIIPSVWYDGKMLNSLLEVYSDHHDQAVGEAARQAGRRMASGTLDGIEEAICHVPLDQLISRLDRFFRIGEERPFRVAVGDDEVVVEQDPAGDPVACALFHGLIEGLVDHRQAAGCMDGEDVLQVECRAEGHDRCSYTFAASADAA